MDHPCLLAMCQAMACCCGGNRQVPSCRWASIQSSLGCKQSCTSSVAVLRAAASLEAADAPKAWELCSSGIEGHCCLCTATCEDC